MHTKYSVNIFWSEEDGCFIGTIPEFPNLSASGDSFEEVAADAESILQLAIESLKRDGIAPPLPKKLPMHQQYSGQVRLRMPKSMHSDLANSAAHEGVSLNTHIINLLSKSHTSHILNTEVKDLFKELHQQNSKSFVILYNKIGESSDIEKHTPFSVSVDSNWEGSNTTSEDSKVMVAN